MNQAKFLAAHASVSSAAKKVYEAVPISEPWTMAQIATELHRQGSSMDYRIAHGCVRALIDGGLVSSPKKDVFCRVPVRAKQAALPDAEDAIVIPAKPEPTPPPKEKTPVTTAKPQQSPIDKLTALSERARAMAAAAKALAADIEAAALELEEQQQIAEAATAKVRQFQALLREVL